MILIELTKPAAEPITVPEAKAWARIERDDEDASIARLVSAARETVEQRTGLVLGGRTFRLVLDAVPADGLVAIARRPLTKVTGVRRYDGDGRETLEAADAVTISAAGLVLAPQLRSAHSLEIEFEGGDESAGEAVRQAMLRIFAASYETRGLVGDALQPALVPAFAAALLAPVRRVAL